MSHKIILISVDRRIQEAGSVQKVLTAFGCNIKIRLGLHEVSTDKCAQDGLIILHVDGKENELTDLLVQLNSIEYVTAKLVEI